MRPHSVTVVGRTTFVIRVGLGAVFLFSSAGKIADPEAFATIVTNFQLLPPQLVSVTAVLVPWIEAVCGMALVVGRFEKGAALLVNVMMMVFIGIILYNGYRGINVACGCFSLAAKEPSNIMLNTLRNLVILAAAGWILYYSGNRHRETVE